MWVEILTDIQDIRIGDVDFSQIKTVNETRQDFKRR